MSKMAFYVYKLKYKGDIFIGYGISTDYISRDLRHQSIFKQYGVEILSKDVRYSKYPVLLVELESLLKQKFKTRVLPIPSFKTESLKLEDFGKFKTLIKDYNLPKQEFNHENYPEYYKYTGDDMIRFSNYSNISTSELSEHILMRVLKDVTRKDGRFAYSFELARKYVVEHNKIIDSEESFSFFHPMYFLDKLAIVESTESIILFRDIEKKRKDILNQIKSLEQELQSLENIL